MAATGESVTEGVELRGRRAVVTGGTSGIGKEIARVLSLRGAHVILPCRDVVRGNAVLASFASPGTALPCELSDMASVRALAPRLQGIDLLFVNAGVWGQPFRLTPEGHEATFATNTLGHFLLLHLLIGQRAFTTSARVIFTLTSAVTSNPLASLDLEQLTQPSAARYSRSQSSPQSKIMLALIGAALPERLRAANLPALPCFHSAPGGVRTEGAEATLGPIARKALGPLLRRLLRPVEEGVAPLLYAATSPEAVPGTIYGPDCRPVKARAIATDLGAAQRVWDACEGVLGLRGWS